MSMRRYIKVIAAVALLLVWTGSLTRCGLVEDQARSALEKVGQAVQSVLDQHISLEAPGTEKTWTSQEELETYLSQSGAYVQIVLRLEDGLEVKDYAKQLLDFLNSVKELNCNLLLQAKANKTYIFHSELDLPNGFDVSTYSLELLEEEIEENLSMGSPVS